MLCCTFALQVLAVNGLASFGTMPTSPPASSSPLPRACRSLHTAEDAAEGHTKWVTQQWVARGLSSAAADPIQAALSGSLALGGSGSSAAAAAAPAAQPVRRAAAADEGPSAAEALLAGKRGKSKKGDKKKKSGGGGKGFA